MAGNFHGIKKVHSGIRFLTANHYEELGVNQTVGEVGAALVGEFEFACKLAKGTISVNAGSNV